ncbi:MAG: AI-2E family transporter, partial [Planctomycetota bacterium]
MALSNGSGQALPSIRDPGFARPFAVVCAIVTAVALAAAALVYLFKLILLLVISCVLSVLFSTVGDALAAKLPGPRALYVILAFLVSLAAFAGLIALFVLPLIDQAEHLASEAPRLIERFAPKGHSVKDAVTEKLPAVASFGVPWLLETLESAFDTLGAVFFGLFMALSPASHREGLLRLFPAWLRPRVDAVVDDAHEHLRGWLGAALIGMTIVGSLTTAGLYLIGIDEWLVFGAFSAGMELVPYAGPFLAFLGPFVSTLLAGQPRTAVLVAGLYIVVQALLMNVIYPYLVKRRADIPASLAIASILLLGRACGPIGVR